MGWCLFEKLVVHRRMTLAALQGPSPEWSEAWLLGVRSSHVVFTMLCRSPSLSQTDERIKLGQHVLLCLLSSVLLVRTMTSPLNLKFRLQKVGKSAPHSEYQRLHTTDKLW